MIRGLVSFHATTTLGFSEMTSVTIRLPQHHHCAESNSKMAPEVLVLSELFEPMETGSRVQLEATYTPNDLAAWVSNGIKVRLSDA